MSKYILTNDYRLHIARQFMESITEVSNTSYYFYAAKHLPFSNNTIPQPYDTTKSKISELYRDMMYGKRVSNNDIRLMIRRVDWESKVFDQYDDTDTELIDKDYYAVVNAGSYYHVWKCLDNNSGNTSTVEPDFSDIDAQDEVYETSDKYRWKYMYTVPSSDVLKFATDTYFPYVANSTVSENAIDGAIDNIKVLDGGRGYDNYFTGTFSSSNIKLDGNNLVYALANTASTENTFYEGCLIYISSGTGVGQYREISGYRVNATTKYIIVNNAFTTTPTNSSEYEIYPRVQIDGTGTESNIAIARAIVNSVGNTIHRVEMFNRGAKYTYITANVIAADIVGVLGANVANVRAIHSPPGGHGYDAAAELFSHNICISVKLANSESNTIVTKNEINQIGILKDPLFSNVIIETTNSSGSFTGSELVYKINPVRVSGVGNTEVGSANVRGTNSDFENQFTPGDYIYIRSGTDHQMLVVNSVINATMLTCTTNSMISNTNTMIYIPKETSYGYVTAVSVGNVVLSNVYGTFETDNYIIGTQSGAFAQINTISRSGVEKGFNTFIQMYHYRVEMISGTFQENEIIYQDALEIANAYVQSIQSLGSGIYKVYTTNQLGIFNTGNTIIGSNSDAIGTILDKWSPEIDFNTGEILYIENIDAVTRQTNQSETFKFILEF